MTNHGKPAAGTYSTQRGLCRPYSKLRLPICCRCFVIDRFESGEDEVARGRLVGGLRTGTDLQPGFRYGVYDTVGV